MLSRRSEAPGEVEYLIKWRQMNYDGISWELAEDVAEDEAIAAFERTSQPPTLKQHTAPLGLGRKPRSEWVKFEASPSYRDGNQLRPYQLEGLNWLSFCWHRGYNSILADEMGLGKTVQTVSLLHYLHVQQGVWGPFIVIAPLSTLGHWQRELASWTQLNTIVYHGNAAARQNILTHEWWFAPQPGARRMAQPLHKFNVLLITYEMINLPYAHNEPHLASTHWRCLVVDEAHRLKNAESKLTRELEQFTFDHMLLLTGTPLQNNPGELYTLLHFLQPAEFPSPEAFKERYGELSTQKAVERLHTAMRPFFLRRMKADVEKSVPPKEEIIVQVELTAIQKQWCATAPRTYPLASVHASVHISTRSPTNPFTPSLRKQWYPLPQAARQRTPAAAPRSPVTAAPRVHRYRAIYERNLGFLSTAATAGGAAHGPSLMNIVMELRKCCNHPFLIEGAEFQILSSAGGGAAGRGAVGQQLVDSAGKMVLVHKLLPKLRKQGRKVLIFSQMTMVLNILEDYLRWQVCVHVHVMCMSCAWVYGCMAHVHGARHPRGPPSPPPLAVVPVRAHRRVHQGQ